MFIRITARARRRKIGNGRILHVMLNVEPELVEATDEFDARLVWIGEDDRGVRMRIVALVLEEQQELVVIHVMPDYRGRL